MSKDKVFSVEEVNDCMPDFFRLRTTDGIRQAKYCLNAQDGETVVVKVGGSSPRVCTVRFSNGFVRFGDNEYTYEDCETIPINILCKLT